MKRFLTEVLLTLVLLAVCGGSREGKELRQIGRALDVDLSAGTLVRFEDSHGGFLGDGKSVAEIAIDGLEGELAETSGWRSLPMTDSAAQAVRLCGEEGALVEDGFYYLYDRHSDSADPYDDSQLHERYSWNFTAAVYDSGNGRLYFYEFDT
ncbi:MAG: hypothetical protein K2P01_02895 [Oscillospiraceae bacterium]|nr:hypothetical protein [Oscillospiraceae bacterium]